MYTDEDSEGDDGDMTAGDLVGYDLWDNDVCVGTGIQSPRHLAFNTVGLDHSPHSHFHYIRQ